MCGDSLVVEKVTNGFHAVVENSGEELVRPRTLFIRGQGGKLPSQWEEREVREAQ